jgi:hypothetical protein
MLLQIISTYTYQSVRVEGSVVTPQFDTYTFKTSKRVPKTGMMLVGWGGNNGSTVRESGGVTLDFHLGLIVPCLLLHALSVHCWHPCESAKTQVEH